MANELTTRAGVSLEAAFDEYHAKVQAIADQLYTTVVRPFCRRNRVHFVTGNGAFLFFRPGDKKFDADSAWTVWGTTHKAKARAPRGWQDILDIDAVGVPGSPSDSLLYFMPDYRGRKTTRCDSALTAAAGEHDALRAELATANARADTAERRAVDEEAGAAAMRYALNRVCDARSHADAARTASLARVDTTAGRAILAELDALRAENERLRESNAMACENPDPKCECCGCDMARQDDGSGAVIVEGTT